MSQPNIVYVFADQLRYDAVGFNGNPVVRTPSLDRLAREGMVFDEAISVCPICGPYRGQLLTGRYSHANGVMDNEYLLADGQETIADLLNAQGYRTAYIGKWHLGHPPYDAEKRGGFDLLVGYDLGHEYYDVSSWRNEDGPFPLVDYPPYVDTQTAIDFIHENRDAPFCLFLSWGPPHWSWDGTRDYGKYPQEFNEYARESLPLRGNVPRQFGAFAREEMADYYGMTASLDACMGRLLDALDTEGLAEDTIVCFTSDHGDHLSSHGYGKPFDTWMDVTLQASKATPYEESVHVPFVMRYPKAIRGNQRTHAPFASVDIMPTLLGLCGVEPPSWVQGRDLSAVATGGPIEPSDSVYLQILGPGWPDRSQWVGLWRGVRTSRYTYARWHDRGGMRMLFDRQQDPWELTNLADEPKAKPIVDELEARLQAWIATTGDPFDTGTRLPDTGMLDLGQRLSLSEYYDLAPQGYAEAIRKYRR